MSTNRRSVVGVFRNDRAHWVGDGFHVRQVIPGPGDVTAWTNPFIMFDYNPPEYFAPTTSRRGVGVHPHRGFETVTIAFDGAVEHRDSSGGGGVIHPGDVQWMTAAGGVLHDEFHAESFSRAGGMFHMAQLWVNLPAANKMDPPKYQAISARQINEVALGGGGTVRVIAGQFGDAVGPASTFTPINLWEVRLPSGAHLDTSFAATDNVAVFVMEGQADVNGASAMPGDLVVLDHDGMAVTVSAAGDGVRLLVLNGEPINEPMVSYGPFVMNTREQIVEAIEDFNAGKFGTL
ncbi:MAG TPA: pirin family protein [Ilumatobacteraceae bacterium]|nr:pirin family protein [Ilumatobacteraceae bacterium]